MKERTYKRAGSSSGKTTKMNNRPAKAPNRKGKSGCMYGNGKYGGK